MEMVCVDVHKNQLNNEPYRSFLEWVKEKTIEVVVNNDQDGCQQELLLENNLNNNMKIIIRNISNYSFNDERYLIEVQYNQYMSKDKFNLYYDLLEKILDQDKYYIPNSIGNEVDGRIVSRNHLYISEIAIANRSDMINVALALINQMIVISTSFQALESNTTEDDIYKNKGEM